MKKLTADQTPSKTCNQMGALHYKNAFIFATTLLLFTPVALLLANREAKAQASFVADINAGGSSSFPEHFVVFHNKLYFSAFEATNGRELWSYDGTTANLVADIRTGSSGSSPRDLTVYNNKLYFVADDGVNGNELWSYDGTTASLEADIRPGGDGSDPEFLTVFNNKLYFKAEGETVGTELWSYDGTSATLAADIVPGSGGGFPGFLTVYDNKLFFSASDGASGFELWSYNGVSASLAADIRTGSLGSNPSRFKVFNDILYFRANNGSSGFELWSYDGTTASLVADIMPGVSSSNPDFLTVFNNKLYFVAQNTTSGLELRSYDGTTVSVIDIVPGSGSSGAQYLAVYNNKLFFGATDGTSGFELWSYNGLNASLAADIVVGSSGSAPQFLTVFDNKLYFRADDGISGNELWVYEEAPSAILWVGSTNSDWDNAGNWVTNEVPTATDNVFISAASGNQPHVTSLPGLFAVCADLEIESGATLTIDAGRALTVNGATTNDGTILLESDPTGTGTIITLGTVGGSGTFIAQQYLTGSGGGTPDGRHWYVAPTVGSTTSGAFSAAGDNRLWAHDESLEVTGPNGTGWSEITDDVTALIPLRGYAARLGATETVEYSGGVFNTGNLSLTDLSRTGTTSSKRGYQLVANPYPSFLNWDMVLDAGTINLEPSIWYRTEQSGSMVFATYNPMSNISVLGASEHIHPGQAFWVRVDADGNTGTIALTNDMRSHREDETLRDGTDLIRLTLTNGTHTDEMVVFFNDLASNGADIYDSEKQMAPAEVPQLWSNVDGARMVINGITDPISQPSVPLGIRVQSAGNYTITATELNLPVGAWLEDVNTGAFQSLDNEPSYAFSSEGGMFNGRFVLHFSAQVVGIGRDAINRVSTDIFAYDRRVNIILSEEAQGTATVLDMAGRVITTTTLQGQRTTIPLNVSAGIYVVRVETGRGVESKRLLITD